jgi:HD-GYP domain-containing protein (c-di-GMP phosphodiesterase class II)
MLHRGRIYLPLNPEKLRSGDVVNFNVYVKEDNPGPEKPEYSLFCRRGEVFKPGHLARIKFNHINSVYYHRRDKDQVEYYLDPDFTLVGDLQFLKQKKRLGATLVPKEDVFLPLSVKNIQLGMRVNFDVFVKYKNIGKMDYSYKILIVAGEVWEFALIEDLKEKNINFIYFREQDEAKVLNYLYYNIDLILESKRLISVKKAELIYNIALLWTRRFYCGTHIRTPEEMAEGFKLVGYLLNTLNQDEYHRQWLQEIRRYGDKLHAHSLNVCILGLAFTKYLGWQDEDIMEFAQGALLHDLGMIEIPSAILNKPGRLSKVERQLIEKHPKNSCLIIKEIAPLSLNSMVMIFQHHEMGDGSGYTQGLKLPLISPWARILRIIDSYEAMISNRSWRDRFDSVDALQEMSKDWSNRGVFDADYLIDFIKFLSGK